MKQSLRNAHHKQTIRFTVVVRCETTQQLCETGIVGSRTDETHGEDGVDGHVEITVVRVPTQRFKDGELWVRGV
jgi:hypothetical protein